MLNDWCITENVQAFCCDTTASKTGRRLGACVLLENYLERNILYLPCRHHIYELILKCVFDTKLCTKSGPDVPIFKRFQQYWGNLNTEKFEPGTINEFIQTNVSDVCSDVINFVVDYLQIKQPREDYRELLELTIIFLGGVPPRGISLRVPGAIHHARWMAKAIYCLKIFLFRSQFRLTQKEEMSIASVCVFIIRLYIKAWFVAPMTSRALYQDLNFLKDLIRYQSIDKSISEVTIKIMCGHLWYLSPEAAALSFSIHTYQ
jgi:hypothetical protein